MANFYDDILIQIQNLMEEESYADAYEIIQNELKMPYIPFNFEQKLYAIKSEIKAHLSENKKISTHFEIDEIIDYLNGDLEMQVIAVEQLDKLALRNHIDVIKEFLTGVGSDCAKVLLIESLYKQEINDNFKVRKNGVFIEFNPCNIIPIDKTDGYLSADNYLQEWLGNCDVNLVKICKTLLIQYCFNYLPYSYSEKKGRLLAFSVTYMAYKMLSSENEWELLWDSFKNDGDNKEEIFSFCNNITLKEL
ncbi:MAG: DUF3196 family protein [Anaerorhabdus sp.]